MGNAEARQTKEINRLYWETERSISEISEELDVSRRALYDAVQPRPAGVPCPECGAELTFRNRTAAQRREAECERCGLEKDIETSAASAEGPEPGAPADDGGWARPSDFIPYDAPRTTLVGGAALIGLAIGAVAALLIRRR